MDDNLNETISTEEARKILGVTRQTLYKLSEKGEIPSRKIGSRYKFIKSEILGYLNNKIADVDKNKYKVWELRGDFATAGIKKMARKTFQELASNIEEIIANAYDGDATLVQIILDYDKRALNIIDDGNGMDEKSLASYVIYGESNKTQQYKSPVFKRSPIGEYGMGGKLAITNLCNICKIVTRKDGKEHNFFMNRDQLNKAKYVSDIRSEVYTKSCAPSLHGTQIFMEQLGYKNIDHERLIERFSSKMPKSQNFKIMMTIIINGERTEIEIREPAFEYVQKFEYDEELKLTGNVGLTVYYTNEPVPANKQGIWTKVNGRIVNEKQNWFGIESLTSGHRYKYRLYGLSEADGLKDYITFAKNDFVDCPEYREYYNFIHACLNKVQTTLLKQDEDAKKERDRNIVKEVEEEVNKIVSKLDSPDVLGNLEASIKKEVTKDIENAPDNPYPDIDKVEEEAKKLTGVVKRGKDNRDRRNQSLTKSEKLTYSGKNYIIETVDLSEDGDIVAFTRNKNLIEINEKHKLYIKAAKENYLNSLIRDIAFTEIAIDYSEGNIIIFNRVFNELARIASKS